MGFASYLQIHSSAERRGPCQRLIIVLFCSSRPLLFEQDIQQLLQLQQLVLVPGHPLPSPAQFLLPQAQQGQQGGTLPTTYFFFP